MLKDLIRKNRSYRRFAEDQPVTAERLRSLIELARLSASAANRQPLKYVLSSDPATNAQIFPHTRWAGYLKDWKGPAEGERPAAYILILGDTSVSTTFSCDHGIAAQSILLGAVEQGLGGCMLGALNREGLRQTLAIPERYEVLLAVALGQPAERIEVDPVGSDGSIEYYRDEQDVHHVPKRALDDLILKTYG